MRKREFDLRDEINIINLDLLYKNENKNEHLNFLINLNKILKNKNLKKLENNLNLIELKKEYEKIIKENKMNTIY
jgi:hypothetical protein